MPTTTPADTAGLAADVEALTAELAAARAEIARLTAAREPIGANPCWPTVEVVLCGDFGWFDVPGVPRFEGWVECVDLRSRRVAVVDRDRERRSVPFEACVELSMRGHIPPTHQ